MRKAVFCTLLLLMILFCTAALADTPYDFSGINARLSLSDSYIVLTPDNLAAHQELLTRLGKTREVVEADFAERHVLLQAWVPGLDACLEITAVQDEDAVTYFDLDQQTNQARSAYRTSVLKGVRYKNLGYDIKSAEWKKQTLGGRFLMIKYKRNVNGYIYWGYARRAIRNGYTFTLDYQVYERGLRAKDLNSLNKVTNTVEFINTLSMPADTEGLLEFTAVPPSETDSGEFSVEGKCTPGAHLTGVMMRMASSGTAPYRVETTARNSGTFKLPVKLPEEGVWLMTLTVELNGFEIAEEVFDITTYSRSTIPVIFDSAVPENLMGDELVLSGKTTRATSIQCLVSNGVSTFDKTMRTNNTGKFTFKVPTSVQAEYDIVLVFTKKGFPTRRLTWTASRVLTEEDIRRQARTAAIKPAYSNLLRKLDAYAGRIMGYNVYITDIQESGTEWVVFAALNKTRKGYSNIIAVLSSEAPNFVVNSEQKMYGTCTGPYVVQSEEGAVTYPGFDLLFWE